MEKSGKTIDSLEIARQPDGNAFILHCGGGFRAGQIDKHNWKIDPILIGGKACIRGPLTTEQLQDFTRRHGLFGIAFESMGWTNGCYHSSWTPINPNRTNHFLGPADLWRNITANITKERTDADLRAMVKPTHETIAALLDNRTEAERLAQSISLSLRSVDISVGQMTDFYHEQLVDLMTSGALSGQRRATSLDQTLYAHVHSFFMHLGAARDYLSAFVAVSIGKSAARTDSLARLIEVVRSDHFAMSPILRFVLSKGFLVPSPTKGHRWESGGWLREVSEFRNEFIHKRPYGEKFFERAGFAKAVAVDEGVYRYVRPIVIESNANQDLLDFVAHHYRESTTFFQDAANASGLDAAIGTIDAKDIIATKTPGAGTSDGG